MHHGPRGRPRDRRDAMRRDGRRRRSAAATLSPRRASTGAPSNVSATASRASSGSRASIEALRCVDGEVRRPVARAIAGASRYACTAASVTPEWQVTTYAPGERARGRVDRKAVGPHHAQRRPRARDAYAGAARGNMRTARAAIVASTSVASDSSKPTSRCASPTAPCRRRSGASSRPARTGTAARARAR